MPSNTIPEWRPGVASAEDLNSQDSLSELQATTTGFGVPATLAYGLNQLGGNLFALNDDKDDGFWTAGFWFCMGEIDGYDTDPLLINGEAPVAGVEVNYYVGASNQGIDPLLAEAITGYSDSLVFNNEQGAVGLAYVVIKYTNDHYSGFPDVKANLRGRKVLDPASGTYVYTTSPALCLADVISNPLVGLGEPVNSASLAALVSDNAELVGGERRREIGISFASAQDTTRVIEILRGYASCWPYQRGGEWFFASDRPRATDATYNQNDIEKNTFKLGQADPRQIPTVVRLIYTDTTTEIWREREVYWPLALAPGVVRRESVVRMPGIQRYSQAIRETIERYNKLQHDETFVMVGYSDMIGREVGDVIEMTHPLGIANRKFRINTQPKQKSPGLFEVSGLEYHESDYSDEVNADPGGDTTGAFFGKQVTQSLLPHISLIDGLIMQNGVGTLSVKIQRNGLDVTTGAYKLYVGGTVITEANGFGVGSDGYLGVLDSANINGLVKIELKDSPTGVPIDVQNLIDAVSGSGGDGEDAIVGGLTNQSHVTQTDENGMGYSLVGAGGSFVIYDGVTDVSDIATYVLVGGGSKNGLNMTIDSSGNYVLFVGAGWTSDEESFTIQATYNGRVINRQYNIAKAKRGSDAIGSGLENFGGTIQNFLDRWTLSGATEGEVAYVADEAGGAGNVALEIGNGVAPDHSVRHLNIARKIPIIDNQLYEIRFKARKRINTNSPYNLGVVGVAADGTTFVSFNGSNTTLDAHYFAAENVNSPASPVYTDYVGYFKKDGTAANKRGGVTTKSNPGIIHPLANYFLPIFHIHDSADSSMSRIGYISWGPVANDGESPLKLSAVPEFTQWVLPKNSLVVEPNQTTNDVVILGKRENNTFSSTETWRVIRYSNGNLVASRLSADDSNMLVVVSGSDTTSLTLSISVTDGSEVEYGVITISSLRAGSDGRGLPGGIIYGGGAMTISFGKNRLSNGAANNGEIQVTAGTYLLPDGTSRSVPTNRAINTPYESNTNTPDSGEFYIIWGATSAPARFTTLSSFGDAESLGLFIAEWNADLNEWRAVDNAYNTQVFTPLDSDYLIAVGIKLDGQSYIGKISQIVATTGKLGISNEVLQADIKKGALGTIAQAQSVGPVRYENASWNEVERVSITLPDDITDTVVMLDFIADIEVIDNVGSPPPEGRLLVHQVRILDHGNNVVDTMTFRVLAMVTDSSTPLKEMRGARQLVYSYSLRSTNLTAGIANSIKIQMREASVVADSCEAQDMRLRLQAVHKTN